MKLIGVIMLIFSASVAFADEVIYFTLKSSNDVYNFTNQRNADVPPKVQIMAYNMFKKPFSIDAIDNSYYNVSVNDDIVWQGEKVHQYSYEAKNGDRFKQIVWLKDDGTLVKLEIYDLDDTLMYSALCVADCTKQPQPSDIEWELFNGFAKIHHEVGMHGRAKLVFTDGLNSFSINRYTSSSVPSAAVDKQIVLGNYVYNIQLDGERYTVVGTIPFDEMEEAITSVATDKFGNVTVDMATHDNGSNGRSHGGGMRRAGHMRNVNDSIQ